MKPLIDQLDRLLSEYLVKKAPPLSSKWKDLLVSAAPFIAVLGVILGLPALLAVFGLGAFLTPFAVMAGARTGIFWLFWIVGVIQVILAALSIKPLQQRLGHGWRLMLYSQLLSILTSLQGFNLVGIALAILSLYLLYQIKASYSR